MFKFLSDPVFCSSIFTFLVVLYFSFLSGRAILRCEQLAKRVQVLEHFNEDILEQVELQLAAKRLRPINGDMSEAQASLEAICANLEEFGSVEPMQPIGHYATNGDQAELARRTVAADRILKDLVHSRSELDKAWEAIRASNPTERNLKHIRQTLGAITFGLLALHDVVTQFMCEFSFVRDHGAGSGYLKFPGFAEHFRKAREAENAKQLRTNP